MYATLAFALGVVAGVLIAWVIVRRAGFTEDDLAAYAEWYAARVAYDDASVAAWLRSRGSGPR